MRIYVSKTVTSFKDRFSSRLKEQNEHMAELCEEPAFFAVCMPHVTRSIPKRRVDDLLALAPVGAELVHEALEMCVVVALPEMRKLVDDDVF